MSKTIPATEDNIQDEVSILISYCFTYYLDNNVFAAFI